MSLSASLLRCIIAYNGCVFQSISCLHNIFHFRVHIAVL
uniref:Uncharacterized protein n=1 Tax=Anguilla anguilla TaxID=7936 RepID=A0A0E9U259_ANGAN